MSPAASPSEATRPTGTPARRQLERGRRRGECIREVGGGLPGHRLSRRRKRRNAAWFPGGAGGGAAAEHDETERSLVRPQDLADGVLAITKRLTSHPLRSSARQVQKDSTSRPLRAAKPPARQAAGEPERRDRARWLPLATPGAQTSPGRRQGNDAAKDGSPNAASAFRWRCCPGRVPSRQGRVIPPERG
jgi:hypothetical protein